MRKSILQKWIFAVALAGIAAGVPSGAGAQEATWDVMQWYGGGSYWTGAGDTLRTGVQLAKSNWQYVAAQGVAVATLAADTVATIGSTVASSGVAAFGVAGEVGGVVAPPAIVAAGSALTVYATLAGLTYLDGVLSSPEPGTGGWRVSPIAQGVGLYYVEDCCYRQIVKVYPDGPAAYAGSNQGTCCSKGWSTNWGSQWQGYERYDGWINGHGQYTYHVFPVEGYYAYVEEAPPNYTPLTPEEIHAQMMADMASDSAAIAAAAKNYGVASVIALSDLYNEWKPTAVAPPAAIPPAAVPGIPANTWPWIVTILVDGVGQAAKDRIAAMDNPDNTDPWDDPADPVVTVGDMTEAVREGERAADAERVKEMEEDQATNGGPSPEPPEPEGPVKKSLTAVLTNFAAGLAGLPVLSWLTGVGVHIQGETSSFTANVPPIPPILPSGASMMFDFATYADHLSNMGNLLLTLVGIWWTIWLFKGRND